MVGWGWEEESGDNPKPVPPPGPTLGTVGVATLGEGWVDVDDGALLIDVLSSIIVLNHSGHVGEGVPGEEFFLERVVAGL